MLLAAVTVLVGVTFGAAIGWLGARYPRAIGAPSWLISYLLSGVPVLVLLLWLHYPAQSAFGVVIDPFITAALTFSVVNIFSVASLIRVHLQEFPQQYIDAARVSGLRPIQIVFQIQLPLILRQILPGLLVLQVTMLHMTLFASLISVEELFRVAQQINSNIYKPIEIYSALGLFFLSLSLPLNGLALWMKRRFSRQLVER